MFLKQSFDKTCTAFENGKKKMFSVYDLLKSLSVRNKASFDLQLKSSKRFCPTKRIGFCYDKEVKVLPLIGILIASMMMIEIIGGICCRKKH